MLLCMLITLFNIVELKKSVLILCCLFWATSKCHLVTLWPLKKMAQNQCLRYVFGGKDSPNHCDLRVKTKTAKCWQLWVLLAAVNHVSHNGSCFWSIIFNWLVTCSVEYRFEPFLCGYCVETVSKSFNHICFVPPIQSCYLVSIVNGILWY